MQVKERELVNVYEFFFYTYEYIMLLTCCVRRWRTISRTEHNNEHFAIIRPYQIIFPLNVRNFSIRVGFSGQQTFLY
jgi:hypothetical protein